MRIAITRKFVDTWRRACRRAGSPSATTTYGPSLRTYHTGVPRAQRPYQLPWNQVGFGIETARTVDRSKSTISWRAPQRSTKRAERHHAVISSNRSLRAPWFSESDARALPNMLRSRETRSTFAQYAPVYLKRSNRDRNTFPPTKDTTWTQHVAVCARTWQQALRTAYVKVSRDNAGSRCMRPRESNYDSSTQRRSPLHARAGGEFPLHRTARRFPAQSLGQLSDRIRACAEKYRRRSSSTSSPRPTSVGHGSVPAAPPFLLLLQTTHTTK